MLTIKKSFRLRRKSIGNYEIISRIKLNYTSKYDSKIKTLLQSHNGYYISIVSSNFVVFL